MLAALLLGALLGQNRGQAALDVCSALQQLSHLDGQVVTIRGEYQAGREVSAIYGSGCAGRIAVDGGTWPWSINVVISPCSGFAERLRTVIAENRPKNWRVIVTLTGQLRSAQNNPSYPARAPKARPMGFGHLGIWPAEILVTAVTDVSVEDKAALQK